MAFDVTQLTSEDLETIAALIKGGGNRSPVWKPLRDMRAPQTQKGRLNRPHFEWSADEPPEGTKIPAYPRLMWDAKGTEYSIANPIDEQRRRDEGWTTAPPMASALSASDRIQSELAALSPEDRQFVIEAQKQARLNKLKEQMSGLSNADLAALMAAQPTADAPVAVTEPAKAKQKTA